MKPMSSNPSGVCQCQWELGELLQVTQNHKNWREAMWPFLETSFIHGRIWLLYYIEVFINIQKSHSFHVCSWKEFNKGATNILDHYTCWFRKILYPGPCQVSDHSPFGEDIFLSTLLN